MRCISVKCIDLFLQFQAASKNSNDPAATSGDDAAVDQRQLATFGDDGRRRHSMHGLDGSACLAAVACCLDVPTTADGL